MPRWSSAWGRASLPGWTVTRWWRPCGATAWVIHAGSALPNTGIPGLIGGFAGERVLRAPAGGVFHQLLDIGAQVRQGDVAATVNGVPMTCTLDGVLRGILPDGTPVHKGMKAGDIDPRCKVEHCYTASDKALAIGGGVLEAILDLTGAMKDRAGGYSG